MRISTAPLIFLISNPAAMFSVLAMTGALATTGPSVRNTCIKPSAVLALPVATCI